MTSLPSVPKFPTGVLLNNSSRAQFYHEVFYPAFQTRVAHYHNSSQLWAYLQGLATTISTDPPIPPERPSATGSQDDHRYFSTSFQIYEADRKLYMEQRDILHALKAVLLQSLEAPEISSIIGIPDTVMSMELPMVWKRIKSAYSKPQANDLHPLMESLNEKYDHTNNDSFNLHHQKFTRTLNTLELFDYNRSQVERIQMFRRTLSNYEIEFAPYIATYDIAYTMPGLNNLLTFIEHCNFAIVSIEAKRILQLGDASVNATITTAQKTEKADKIPPSNRNSTNKRRYYCHTCGTNFNHGSRSCTTPGPTHDKSANYFNQKGGKPSH